MPLIEFKCYPRDLSAEKKAKIALKVVDAVMSEIDAPKDSYIFTCEEISKEDWSDIVLTPLKQRSDTIVMNNGAIIL